MKQMQNIMCRFISLRMFFVCSFVYTCVWMEGIFSIMEIIIYMMDRVCFIGNFVVETMFYFWKNWQFLERWGEWGSGSGRIVESMILIYMYGFITHLKHVVKYSTLVN